MGTEQQAQEQEKQQENKQESGQPGQPQAADQQAAPNDVDGLKDKKPEELTPEELRLMADTMPGEGPGD